MSITTTQTNTNTIVGTPTLTNPFLGLRAFGPEDHHLFFGREEQSMELLRRLRRTRFLAISGQSGSGKSSLVKSGLVPALQKGFIAQAGSQWRIASFRPGLNPIHNLAQSIAKRNVLHSNSKMEPNYPEHVEATLRRSSLGIVVAYQESKIRDNLLIVVDQFEELFKYHELEKTSTTAQTDAISFVNSLLVASNQRDYPIYIVITMRSDFFGDTTEFRGLAESINKGQYLIPRMKREEIRKAITSPILYAGASITPRLRSRLLNDVGEDADQLPILQHALMRMWDHWMPNESESASNVPPIDLRHYEAIGGMENALNKHLEEAYNELRTEDEKEICEKLFKALTDTSSDGRGVRRSITLSEACQIVEASEEEVLTVMEPFRRKGRHFLVPEPHISLKKDTSIGISHEVMMRKWERLITWVEEEQKSAEIYKRLASAANLYITGKSGLWRDPELQIATNWYDEDEPNLAWAKRYNPNFEEAIDFLNKSKEQAAFEVAQIEARRQRELENSKRFNRIVGTAGLIAILLSLMSGYFYYNAKANEKKAEISAQEAIDEKKEAKRQEMAALQAEGQAKKNAEIAREAEKSAKEEEEKAREAEKSAKAAEKIAKNAEKKATENAKKARLAEEAANKNANEAKKAKEKAYENERKANVARDKALALQKLSEATALAAKSIRVEDEKSKVKALLAAQAYHHYKKSKIADSLKYNYSDIYSGLYYGLRAIHGINFNAQHDEHTGAVRSLRFSNGSDKHFYTTGSDGSLLKWYVQSWQGSKKPKLKINTITSQRKVMNNLAVSSNNKWLAVGGKIANIEVYDPRNLDAQPIYVPKDANREVLFLEFLPDNNTFVYAAKNYKSSIVRSYNLQSKKSTLLDSTNRLITNLAIGEKGKSLVWGTNDGKITLWNTYTKEKTIVEESGPKVTSLGISPDGTVLIAGLKETGSVGIWEKQNNTGKFKRTRTLEQHTAHVNDIAFSPKGDKIATASYDGTVRVWVWDLLKGKSDYQPMNLDDHDSWAMSVDFSKDGKYVIVGTQKGEIRFWDLGLNELVSEICSNVNTELTGDEKTLYLGKDFPYENPCQ